MIMGKQTEPEVAEEPNEEPGVGEADFEECRHREPGRVNIIVGND